MTLVLTPLVFLLGEVLPKELSRRRPHGLIGAAVPLLALSRVVFWPLERVLSLLAWLLQRALGVQEGRRVLLRGRASVNRFLEEGAATYDETSGRFKVDLAKLETSIEALVRDVCMMQHAGDPAAVQKFLDTYGVMSKPMEAALSKLDGIPVDLRPYYPAAGEQPWPAN